MAPISKITGTWIRKTSQTAAEGFSSSSEDNPIRNGPKRARKKSSKSSRSSSVPSFMASEAGRSYVDPWDMENYSFLRRQLEDVSLASDNDNVSSTPAFETTQSDFYYVPLDHDGSPQYQYKQYLDAGFPAEDMTSLPYREDPYGRVAGVDERDFCNDYLDPRIHSREVSGSFMEYNNNNGISNPSRQSERSRYNNQDYQNYTPPSLDPEQHYATGKNYPTNSLYRKGRKSYSDLHLNESAARYHRERTTINRRQSFQNLENNYVDTQKRKQKVIRRQSVHEIARDTTSRNHTKTRRRESFHELATDDKESIYGSTLKKNHSEHRTLRRSSIHEVDYNRRVSRKGSFFDDTNGYADSSLVYVYETARRRRAMVLPNPEAYRPREIRFYPPDSEAEDSSYGMIFKPEVFAARPLGRYAMTNYGHLKIDYSCSWNNLDRYISDKARA